ncbi:MAG: hypothetical protein ABIZ91_04070, partial [Gemmatimonadaceae bacterium]
MIRTSRRNFLFTAAPLAFFPSTALAALNACSGDAAMSDKAEGTLQNGQVAVRKLDKPHEEWK